MFSFSTENVSEISWHVCQMQSDLAYGNHQSFYNQHIIRHSKISLTFSLAKKIFLLLVYAIFSLEIIKFKPKRNRKESFIGNVKSKWYQWFELWDELYLDVLGRMSVGYF